MYIEGVSIEATDLANQKIADAQDRRYRTLDRLCDCKSYSPSSESRRAVMTLKTFDRACTVSSLS